MSLISVLAESSR